MPTTTTTTSPTLATLPADILLLLPAHLATIEDHLALSATSRRLRAALAHTSPRALLRLCAASSSVFFRPAPGLLVAACAGELAAWAAQTPTRAHDLRNAFRGGMEGLLELCVAVCGLSMERIRWVAGLRFGVLNIVGDLVDKCVGAQWYTTPRFWNGGVSDAWTLHAEPSATVLHMAVYGSLFGGALIRAIIHGTPVPASAALDARLDYIKYCVPDWACFATQNRAWGAVDRSPLPRRRVDPVGPYADGADAVCGTETHQLALAHLLRSRRWRGEWSVRVRTALQGGVPWERTKKPLSWRQLLWEQAVVWGRGLEGLAFLAGEEGAGKEREQGVSEADKAWLREVRAGISRLEREPERAVVGRQVTWEQWPWLAGDLAVCTSGYVCGT